MSVAIALNIILAAFVLVAVVAPLAWAIHRSARELGTTGARTRVRTTTRSQARVRPASLITES